MPEGKIKWYDETKGYGLIAPDQGDKDVIFQKSTLHGFAQPPSAGDRVQFEPIDPRRGTQAAKVQPA